MAQAREKRKEALGSSLTSELVESPRPLGPQRQESLHPGLHPSVTNVPVTPGIHIETYASGNGSEDTNSYFFSDIKSFREQMAGAPDEATGGAVSDREILRRMSVSAAQSQDSSDLADPRLAHPGLSLSGNVISVNFCIPHSLVYRRNADWELKQRRGTSALFDSFTHLSSDKTPWNHTLIGWTGEIKPSSDEPTPPDTPPPSRGTTLPVRKPLNKSSAPIPVDGVRVPDAPPPQSIGVHINKDDQMNLERQLAHEKLCKTVPVWLYDDNELLEDGSLVLKDQARWRRYAEHNLYTLFHYKQHEPTDGRGEKISWADYYRMNVKFANKVLEIYKPGDIIMIHDYHLLLLPSMLRQKIPHMYISFFLHVPFPSSEFLRCLPRRNEILEGMLSANLIGFQSYSYSRHFVSCCTRILGFPGDLTGVDAFGSKVTVGVFPIGIDAKTVERLAFDNEDIDDKVAGLKELYKDKKVIVGRDRLDSVRGVAQKLMAFERLLENYPEWRGNVVLIQVTSPTSVEEEKEDAGNKIANKVAELVSRINGLYGTLTFEPVAHYSQYLSQDEYLALLRLADIGLITSVRDGMNTTSLEYVVCQREQHGPLILSEFSGTAGSLKKAIHINPWDLSGVAEAVNNALLMPESEKSKMHKQLYQHVTTYNVHAWSNSCLRRLLNILSSQNNAIATPALDKAKMLRQYRKANKRLFMFDYDGTLTPIVKDPNAALPSEKLLRTITTLAKDHRNAIWIISGRDQEFLGQHLGHIPELGFSAEHGSFMRHPGSEEWENLAESFDMGWQKEVMECFQKYTEKTQGSFIERKRCALTWHYRRADPELGEHNARACQKELNETVGKKWDVEVMTGKANLEVRPTFINKGEIVKRLIADYGHEVGCAPEFLICAGDDTTDEDMFRSLNGSGLDEDHYFTVTIGASSKMTLAHWHLLEPQDVINSMALLTGEDTAGVDLGALSVVEGRNPTHNGAE